MQGFFRDAENVDVRNSTFNDINGNQHNYYHGNRPPTIPRPSSSNNRPSPSRPEMPPQRRDTNSRRTTAIPYIHTAYLPNMGTTLDDALTRFDTNISPWKYPHDWNRANATHISSIVKHVKLLTGSDAIDKADLGANMIYPRLIVYIFAHMTLCSGDTKDFEHTLGVWRAWDDVTAVQNHRLVKEYLREVVRKCLHEPKPALHTKEIYEKLVALDVISLSAQLTILVTDDMQYKRLVVRRGDAAQALLDLLQARLDFPIDPRYKPRYLKALIKLSELSKKYPECLVLRDVTLSADATDGGSFGDVYRGRLRGHNIAVKVLKVYQKSVIDELRKSFAREAVTWRQLSHPNVLPFYGIFLLVTSSERLCLVCPWMENGNLRNFLSDKAPNTNCVPLMLDVAQGLEYLHSQSIIHADLKSLNILVSDSGRACLADFGLSVAKDSRPVQMTMMSSGGTSGTTRWNAPELMPDMDSLEDESDTKRPNAASDVYAFAMMFSGRFPFEEISNDYQVLTAVTKGKRPNFPSDPCAHTRGLTDSVWEIIKTCWHQIPEQRLTASKAVQRLHTLPNRTPDFRPVDNFTMPSPSLMMYKQAQHPFAILDIVSEQSGNGERFVPGPVAQMFGAETTWQADGRRDRSGSGSV